MKTNEDILKAAAVLGLSRATSILQLKRRYRELVKAHHPDWRKGKSRPGSRGCSGRRTRPAPARERPSKYVGKSQRGSLGPLAVGLAHRLPRIEVLLPLDDEDLTSG